MRESQREDSMGLLLPHAGSCVPSCPTQCWRASASSTLRASSLGRSRGSAEVSKAPARIGSGSVLCSFWYVLLLPAYETDPPPPHPCCTSMSWDCLVCCVGRSKQGARGQFEPTVAQETAGLSLLICKRRRQHLPYLIGFIHPPRGPTVGQTLVCF